MNWFLKAIKQYADFRGRARRKEFWMFTLLSILIGLLLQLLDNLLGLEFTRPNRYSVSYGPLYLVYCFAIFIPSFAVSVRRLHDTGRSGWYLLLWLFILIGWLWLLVLHCLEGTSGPNRFGSDPKNGESFNDDALDSHLTT